MAPESVMQDRVYNAIKEDFLAGEYRRSSRIDLQAIADRHRSSTTPVREAIHRLMGERLVEAHPDGGFRLAIPDASRLSQLYSWNSQMLLSAMHLATTRALQVAVSRFRDRDMGQTPLLRVGLTGGIFLALAEATANTECIEQIEAINLRLHYPRLAEAELFSDLPRELGTLTRNGDLDVRKNVRRRILSYHRRRIERAGEIAALVTG